MDPQTTETAATEPTTTLSAEQEESSMPARQARPLARTPAKKRSGPVHGGRLVYGIEADTANPFVHVRVVVRDQLPDDLPR